MFCIIRVTYAQEHQPGGEPPDEQGHLSPDVCAVLAISVTDPYSMK